MSPEKSEENIAEEVEDRLENLFGEDEPEQETAAEPQEPAVEPQELALDLEEPAVEPQELALDLEEPAVDLPETAVESTQTGESPLRELKLY